MRRRKTKKKPLSKEQKMAKERKILRSERAASKRGYKMTSPLKGKK